MRLPRSRRLRWKSRLIEPASAQCRSSSRISSGRSRERLWSSRVDCSKRSLCCGPGAASRRSRRARRRESPAVSAAASEVARESRAGPRTKLPIRSGPASSRARKQAWKVSSPCANGPAAPVQSGSAPVVSAERISRNGGVGPPCQLGDERRLADPRLAADEDHPPLAADGRAHQVFQPAELLLAAHEGHRPPYRQRELRNRRGLQNRLREIQDRHAREHVPAAGGGAGRAQP
jgi:hypothetical protein